MDAPKLLFNVVILFGVRISHRSYTFFKYFKTLRMEIYCNIFCFKNFKASTFLIEKY